MFQGKVKTEWLTKGALSPTRSYNNKAQVKTGSQYLMAKRWHFNKAHTCQQASCREGGCEKEWIVIK
jgi:hypothetical protein